MKEGFAAFKYHLKMPAIVVAEKRTNLYLDPCNENMCRERNWKQIQQNAFVGSDWVVDLQSMKSFFVFVLFSRFFCSEHKLILSFVSFNSCIEV